MRASAGVYVLAFVSILFGAVGQFLLKLGADNLTTGVGAGAPLWRSVLRLFLVPQILIGLVFFGSSFIMWVFVLTKLPLSVAYPMVSLSYVAVTILAAVFLREPVTVYKLIGLILVTVGVAVLNVKAT